MKKVFSLALVAGMFAFASCESKPAETTEATTETEVSTEATEVDTTAAVSTDSAAVTTDSTTAVQ
ncbi:MULTISPECIES: hypothetical protein [Rufibacter]|uniref:Entericidin n=1 Tax=Rufibacter quisquiliarum TaxID=1549639 RepID=A0A839GP74_9BACT|nr:MULTISPECIES: hypothetical protein [Rufibacter]MBA9075651.1 hypothetical protein [Rufibacter quisquiliarum]